MGCTVRYPSETLSVQGDRGLFGDGGIVFRPHIHARISLNELHQQERVTRNTKVHWRLARQDEWTSEELLANDKKQMKTKKKRSVAGVDQDELLDPFVLADPDSLFHEFRGIQIHHKLCNSEEEYEDELIGVSDQEGTSHCQFTGVRLRMPMILLHGFGASLFSWNKVMKPLSDMVPSKVLAFDRPAFGLTSRVEYLPDSSPSMVASTHLNPYSMAFSVLVTLSFIDLMSREKAVIVGHSAGCLVAVESYFEAPERIAALILVAPAIVAPLIPMYMNQQSHIDREYGMKNEKSSSTNPECLFYRIWKFLSSLVLQIQSAIIRMVKWIVKLIYYFYKKMAAAVLRSYIGLLLIRITMDRFGIEAVRNSWHDTTRLTEYDINGYTKPLKAKGWERALLEFVIAMLIDSETMKRTSKSKLSEISCPVLIITGDDDRLVPAWNAKRLSQAIPGSHLEVIQNCGHLPHEERPEEFLSAVQTFLLKAFRNHVHLETD